MSRWIVIRLLDDIAAFLDSEVTSGRASSRTAVVARALERERRRMRAPADVEILRRHMDDDLVRHVGRLPIDLE